MTEATRILIKALRLIAASEVDSLARDIARKALDDIKELI